MSRTVLHPRIHRRQTTDNQVRQAAQAGYTVGPHCVYTETIRGAIPAMERPVFASVVSKLKAGDVLVVAKLDRLGRNASDIDRTVEHLCTAGIWVVVLDLPVMEVTNAAGDLVRRMFAAFAQFERDQLVERTHAGLARAKAEGKSLGRKDALSVLAAKRGIELGALHQEIREKLSNGATARGAGKGLRGIIPNNPEGSTGILI